MCSAYHKKRGKKNFSYSTKTSFSNYVNKILKRVLGNRDVSLNTLRHSYVNYISTLNLTVGQGKRVAKKMGHGMKKNMEYMLLGGEKEK